MSLSSRTVVVPPRARPVIWPRLGAGDHRDQAVERRGGLRGAGAG